MGANRMYGWIKTVCVMALSIGIAACGGGGGSSGTSPFGSGGGGGGGAGGGGNGSTTGGTVTPGQPSITVALSSSTVTGANPATVTSVVRDATGAGVAGQVVSFSTAGGLGKFSAPSALTDASGTATVSVQPASSSTVGADQVVASATLNSTQLTAKIGFQLAATTVSIGSFTSDNTVLGAYGQANLTLALVGTTAGVPVNVAVSSACVAKGKATLTPANSTTSTGSATFTYRDNGCGATDVSDTVQVSIVGTSATASVSLTLTSPTVSSIAFVEAQPSTIYLKGSGLNETSQVTFQVRDTAGNGIAGQNVTLELVTAAGGVTMDGALTPVSKVTDSSGNVIARINSGTIPTPVRIKATLASVNVSTVSSNLAVAVGLPSQLNFSLSQGTRNIEGMDIDGTPNTYQIIASDRLGNPVPDGTSINFVTEGGQVEAIKFTQTVGGLSRVTANFLSSSPRPSDGRVTVLAYALGEESFLDSNGDNTYTCGESFQDLGDVFLSRGYRSAYDPAIDQLIPLAVTSPGSCSGTVSNPGNPLLALDRSIPSVNSAANGSWGRAYVRRAIETVFSTSAARPVWASKPATQFVPNGSQCPAMSLSDVDPLNPEALIVGTYYTVGGGGLYNLGTIGTFSFYLSDANSVRLNPMAAGTTASVSATEGIDASVAGGSPVPSTTASTFVTVNYNFKTASAGTITLNVKSPSGFITTIPIFVAAGAPGAGLVNCP